MTPERLEEILSTEESPSDQSKPCHILQGLNLIAKYLPNKGIEGAAHDMVYACDVSELAEAGITEDDALLLVRLGWLSDYDSLAHFT